MQYLVLEKLKLNKYLFMNVDCKMQYLKPDLPTEVVKVQRGHTQLQVLLGSPDQCKKYTGSKCKMIRKGIAEVPISSCSSSVLDSILLCLIFQCWSCLIPLQEIRSNETETFSCSHHCCYRGNDTLIEDQALHMWSIKSVLQPLPLSQGPCSILMSKRCLK